eukprot:s89_g41.t1
MREEKEVAAAISGIKQFDMHLLFEHRAWCVATASPGSRSSRIPESHCVLWEAVGVTCAPLWVRNTFIEQIPGTPSSPFDRQVQSCPGTSILHHATPDDRAAGTALQAVPSSPASDASEQRLGNREKPWSPDLVASLVNAAATAVEMATPSLPGLRRRRLCYPLVFSRSHGKPPS